MTFPAGPGWASPTAWRSQGCQTVHRAASQENKIKVFSIFIAYVQKSLVIDTDTKNPPRFKGRVHSFYLLMKSDKVLEDFRITSRKTAISICSK